jgi:hypothetical protein
MKEIENKKDPLEVLGCARGYSFEELTNDLPRHFNFYPGLIKQISKIPEVVLRNSGTPIAKKVNRMMREISAETYRAIQFTRTEINNRGVLFGIVSLKHKVIDRVLNYFHNRWPECVICLNNEFTHKTSTINEVGLIYESKSPLKTVVEKISKNRPFIPYFDDIQFTCEEIFETLYNSQFIPERENKTFFKRMIPDKCFELPGMKGGAERRFRNKQINDYF